MMQTGAGTLLHFSLKRTEQRDHHSDGAAGVLQEDGVAKIESADGFSGGADLQAEVGVHGGSSVRGGRDRDMRLHDRGQAIADGLLQGDAVFKLRDVILDDRGHRSLQLAGESVQELEMLGGMLLPD